MTPDSDPHNAPWRRYIRFWGARADKDLDEEIAYHIQARIDEYRSLGMDDAAARAAALDRFGEVNRYRAETLVIEQREDRRRTMSEFLGSMRDDFRFAARQLRRNRSLALSAVSCLALGIGASTSMFSVVNAVLFRPLPFVQADRLVLISEGWSKIMPDIRRIASPNLIDFEETRGRAFESLGLLQSWSGTIVGTGDAELVPGARVTPSLFEVLGVRPAIGRAFEPSDAATGAPFVIIITDAFWRRHYGADSKIVGKAVRFSSGRSAQIIGVMPASFRFPFSALGMETSEMLVPFAITPDMLPYRGDNYDGVAIGRLSDGVSTTAARAALVEIANQLPARYPETYGRMPAVAGQHFVHVTPLSSAVNGEVRRPLLLLFGAVAFLLLVSCINVASLFVARTAARRREIDIRRALGATRGRLAQQFFAEACLIAVTAGIVGLALAHWGASALVAATPNEFYHAFDIAIDGRVTSVALGVTLLTAFGFALLPGRASDNPTSLGDNERAASAAPAKSRVRRILIVAEIGLALVLTVGAALMIRSFARARAVDPGFDPARLITFRINLPQSRYGRADRVKAAELHLVDRLRQIPGVAAVSAASPLPMATDGWTITFTPQGSALSTLPLATNAFVLPGFLETMSVKLRAGRTFTTRDDGNAPPVVIVNETLARRYFGGGTAIGRQLKWGSQASPSPWLTIVGVVGDVKHDRLDGDAQPSVYMPVLQQDTGLVSMYQTLSYVVRSADKGAPSMRVLRSAVHEVDPQLAVVAGASMDVLVGHSIAGRRFNALLIALFSALALMLASTGVYGLLQYSVLQRTREIGVRVALGARQSSVMRLVVGEALALAGIGVILGLAGALVVTRAMRTLLFETSPIDPVSFAVGGVLLLLVSLVASYLPTRRALAIDPAIAMRGD